MCVCMCARVYACMCGVIQLKTMQALFLSICLFVDWLPSTPFGDIENEHPHCGSLQDPVYLCVFLL